VAGVGWFCFAKPCSVVGAKFVLSLVWQPRSSTRKQIIKGIRNRLLLGNLRVNQRQVLQFSTTSTRPPGGAGPRVVGSSSGCKRSRGRVAIPCWRSLVRAHGFSVESLEAFHVTGRRLKRK